MLGLHPNMTDINPFYNPPLHHPHPFSASPAKAQYSVLQRNRIVLYLLLVLKHGRTNQNRERYFVTLIRGSVEGPPPIRKLRK